MKVTQEKLPDSQIGLEIEVSAEASKDTYEKVIKKLTKTANIPGFRKGRVPRPILLQRIGSKQVKAAALEEIIQKYIPDAIEQESIESLGNYQLKSSFEELVGIFTPGQPFTFSASVDVPPTIELGDYTASTLKAEEIAYNPQKVEDWLKERQEQQATLVPIEDRGAEMGDVVIVDYQGRYADSEDPLEEVKGTDFKVDMEEGRLIPGMVEGMVGMKPEETKDISVTFPEDYPQETLAGKPVIFTVTLKELKAKELPELDDDFAEEVSEFETIGELRTSLEEKFKEEAESRTKDNIYNEIVQNLVEISTFDLPDTLIQEQVTQVLMETVRQLEQMGVDVQQFLTQDRIPEMRQSSRPDAIKRLKQDLVVKEVTKVQEIEADEEAIAKRSEEIRSQLPEEGIDEEKLKEIVVNEVTSKKTLEWLHEQMTVELVPEGTLSAAEEEESDAEASEEESKTIDVEAVATSEEE
ncbi:MAG: trigger factor [Microcystaceae cyanobacterium]